MSGRKKEEEESNAVTCLQRKRQIDITSPEAVQKEERHRTRTGAQRRLSLKGKECGVGRFLCTEIGRRGEAADQERNAFSSNGVKIAATDTRSTVEVEDGKHTSGGEMIAAKKKKWPRRWIRLEVKWKSWKTIAQHWMNCTGGLQIFAAYFWHSEGWTASETLLEAVFFWRTRERPYPWSIACDANLEPGAFVQGKWFHEGK